MSSKLVQVSLRHEGKKFSLDEVRAADPLLVELAVERRTDGLLLASLRRPWLDATLGHGMPSSVLCDVRLVRLRGVGPMWETRHLPQAWWCRLPAEGEAARPAPKVYTPLPIDIPERWK